MTFRFERVQWLSRMVCSTCRMTRRLSRLSMDSGRTAGREVFQAVLLDATRVLFQPVDRSSRTYHIGVDDDPLYPPIPRNEAIQTMLKVVPEA